MRIYRASGLGGCMRAQIAEQLDYRAISTDKQMESFGREGQIHEDEVAARLGDVSRRQEEVALTLSPSFDVIGHIDGIRDGYLFEVKSMSKDEYGTWLEKRWDKTGLIQRYKWQTSVYMIALGLPMHFVVKCRDNGKIDESYVYQPFYSRQEILARVLAMETFVRKGELPDECDVVNWPCPFYYLHDEAPETYAEDEELDVFAQMYEDERLAVKVATGRQKEARKALDDSMAGRDKVTTEKVKVTYYQSKRRALDVSKMKEELGEDEVERFMKETISKGLRVTIRDEDKGGKDGEGTGGDGTGEGIDKSADGDAGEISSASRLHGESS